MKKLGIFIALPIIMSYSYLTIIRNRDWKDDLTLWARTAVQAPTSPRVLYNLGNAYDRRGMLDESVVQYKKAISIDPYSAEHYNNLGCVYVQKRLYDDAKKQLRIALKLEPSLALAHHNLGTVYEKEGNYKDAIKEFQIAIGLNPNSLSHYNLACVYGHEGKLREALYHYGEAVALDPSSVKALNNLGHTYLRIGMVDAAKDAWQRVLEIDPDFEMARDNLKKLESLAKEKATGKTPATSP